jgi:hypothetical protein
LLVYFETWYTLSCQLWLYNVAADLLLKHQEKEKKTKIKAGNEQILKPRQPATEEERGKFFLFVFLL